MKDILSRCLKTRIGGKIPVDLCKELIKVCRTNKYYSSLVEKGTYSIVNKNCTIAGRKRKYVCFVKNDKVIPITKNRLFEKEKRPCKHCGERDCKRKQVISTFRKSIQDQIDKYKRDLKIELVGLHESGQFELFKELSTCPLSGIPLRSCKGTHVDHILPFSKILEDFCSEHQLSLCYIKLKGYGNNKIFADTELDELWKQYHLKVAKLQLVCKKANLKKSNKY